MLTPGKVRDRARDLRLRSYTRALRFSLVVVICIEIVPGFVTLTPPAASGGAQSFLHATILHLLGLDHERLTYRYAGRDFRLTDVHGNVVKEVLT